MDNKNNGKSQSKDNKQIAIFVAIGVIVIACICCLLIVAGYFLYNDLTKTAIASPQPTSEVILVPTLTLKTTSPTSAPVMTVIPTSSQSADVPFIDDFSSNTNNWLDGTNTTEYGTITYTIDGSYTWDVSAKKPVEYTSWAAEAPIVENFVVSVDATHVSGANNDSYGIAFRVTDNDNKYYFGASEYDGGEYYVGLCKNGTWVTLVDWQKTTSIKINALNNLKVMGEGDDFTFYINDFKVMHIKDSSLTQDGTAGLAVNLYNAGDTSTVEFDNFSITTP